MNRKLALIILIFSLVIGLRVDAASLEEIEIENIIQSAREELDLFDLKDQDIKKILETKLEDEKIDYIEIEEGSKIRTRRDDNYLLADYLVLKNEKLNHGNKFIFMDGEVLLENNLSGKIKDRKIISTRLERRLVKEKRIDYDYWNQITYQKGGHIKFDDPGYYLLTIKDSSYQIDKDNILIKVKEKEKEPVKIIFKDIKDNDWFEGDVYAAVELGLINGREIDKYEPEGQLTVAEALNLAAKIRSNHDDDEVIFIDQGKDWYKKAVDYSIEKKIINTDDFKDYKSNITREEMAYVFARILPEESYNVINRQVVIPDLPANDYDQYIIKLYKAGILNGREYSGEFDPKIDINRGEVAAIINRIVNKDNRKLIK